MRHPPYVRRPRRLQKSQEVSISLPVTAIVTRGELVTESGKFFKKICDALDMDPTKLVKMAGVSAAELNTLKKTQRSKVDLYGDPMWPRMLRYVNKRLAMTMAVREEFQRKLREDRARLLTRRLEIENR